MLKTAIPHLDELSASEKLILLEELWDNLAEQPSAVPVPEWQKRDLEARYQEISAKPF